MAERIIQVNLKKSTSISIASHACTALLKRIPLVYKDMRSGSACSRSAAPSHSRTYPKHCTPKSMARASQPPSQPARPPARRLPASQAAPPSSQPSGMSRSCSCQARQPKAAHRHSQFATRTYGFCQKCLPKNGALFAAVFRQAFIAKSVRLCAVSLTLVAEKRQQKRCRFSARLVQGSLRLRSSSHPRRSPLAPQCDRKHSTDRAHASCRRSIANLRTSRSSAPS